MTNEGSKGTAVITGGSSGIGTAFADRLAARGYDLLLVARRADRLQAAAADLAERHNVAVDTMVADLEKDEDVARLERHIIDNPITMLINNAGTGGLGPTAVAGAARQEKLIRLNISALTRLSLAALQVFRASGTGALVNISSVIAFAPSPAAASYSGSKAYVLNFTRSLQLEYANSEIRIQAVLPGPIRTEFFSSQGISEDIFPASAYLSADELVDAALAGLDAGETITIPTLGTPQIWDDMEALRQRFLVDVLSGNVADRYR
jgi:short-subunit dehydrogenase